MAILSFMFHLRGDEGGVSLERQNESEDEGREGGRERGEMCG